MHFTFLPATFALLIAQGLASPAAIPQSLAKRDGINDCKGGTYSGAHNDGDGVYVASDSETHPYKFPAIRKCWQDYFVTETSLWNQQWQKASGDIYCTGTSLCTAAELTGSQTCQTRSETVSVDIGAKSESVSLGLSYSVSLDNQQCTSASLTSSCAWNDGGCHTVWTQQQMVRQNGYMRKRCNWGNGDETDCMTDWFQDTPTTFVGYGCGSKCGDTNPCGHTDGMPC